MIDQARELARKRVAEAGLPKAGDEEWRFTPLAPIMETKFAPAQPSRLSGSDAAKLFLTPISCYRLVFSNGALVPELSRLPDTFKLGGMTNAVDAALLLGEDEKGFGALATSKFQDGPYVVIPKGLKADKPIHVVYVATAADKPQEAHYRAVFSVGSGASAVIVEEYVGRGAGAFFSNSVSRLELGEDAAVEHYLLLRETEGCVGVRGVRAVVGRNARYVNHAVGLGGRLSRADIDVRLGGEGADASLNGLYVLGGAQHFDFHTNVTHAVPHGTSRELYKGVLDGRARAVFNGMIEVAPNAQQTDAQVYNKNLLLSEDGLVNTKPEFKIHANDVQCKHGATIGQLRADALFYLRSRGIGEAEARSLLVYAFASEMLGRMTLEPVREALAQKLQAVAGLDAGAAKPVAKEISATGGKVIQTREISAPERKSSAKKAPAAKGGKR